MKRLNDIREKKKKIRPRDILEKGKREEKRQKYTRKTNQKIQNQRNEIPDSRTH